MSNDIAGAAPRHAALLERLGHGYEGVDLHGRLDQGSSLSHLHALGMRPEPPGFVQAEPLPTMQPDLPGFLQIDSGTLAASLNQATDAELITFKTLLATEHDTLADRVRHHADGDEHAERRHLARVAELAQLERLKELIDFRCGSVECQAKQYGADLHGMEEVSPLRYPLERLLEWDVGAARAHLARTYAGEVTDGDLARAIRRVETLQLIAHHDLTAARLHAAMYYGTSPAHPAATPSNADLCMSLLNELQICRSLISWSAPGHGLVLPVGLLVTEDSCEIPLDLDALTQRLNRREVLMAHREQFALLRAALSVSESARLADPATRDQEAHPLVNAARSVAQRSLWAEERLAAALRCAYMGNQTVRDDCSPWLMLRLLAARGLPVDVAATHGDIQPLPDTLTQHFLATSLEGMRQYAVDADGVLAEPHGSEEDLRIHQAEVERRRAFLGKLYGAGEYPAPVALDLQSATPRHLRRPEWSLPMLIREAAGWAEADPDHPLAPFVLELRDIDWNTEQQPEPLASFRAEVSRYAVLAGDRPPEARALELLTR